MKSENKHRAPRRLTVAMLACSLSLVGCMPAPLTHMMELPGNVVPDKDSVIITQPRKFEQGAKETESHARKFALMALFAKTVYRHDLLDDKARSSEACSYLGHEEHRDVLLDMPRDEDGSWARWSIPGACYQEGGLYFETYVHRNTRGVMDEAVIAIRGTENYSIPELRSDWGANLSGIFPHASDEYARAAKHVEPLIKHLAGGLGGTQPAVDIYLAGHSLGGGIAQYLAYLNHPQIKATFTFNTSPVTHWSQLPPERQKVEPPIHRVYMNNEFLAYVREFTNRFNAPRFARTDYQFFFVKQNAVGAHDMSHFACQFAARLGDGPGEHHYSQASAHATLQNPVLCPNHVLDEIPPNLRTPR